MIFWPPPPILHKLHKINIHAGRAIGVDPEGNVKLLLEKLKVKCFARDNIYLVEELVHKWGKRCQHKVNKDQYNIQIQIQKRNPGTNMEKGNAKKLARIIKTNDISF